MAIIEHECVGKTVYVMSTMGTIQLSSELHHNPLNRAVNYM